MLNRIALLIVAIACTLIVTSGVTGIQSNGAPIASTNAPGELTCNRSPCHTGSALNSGSGLLTVDIANSTGNYVPGATYDITITMSQTDILRFGFQTLAVFDADSTNAGTFTVTDGTRTQVLEGINQYAGRHYMTYKYPGTEAFSAGMGQWTFQWTAPAIDNGPITFYTAAAAANNDGTDDGDLIYTQQLSLQPSALSVQSSGSEFLSARIYPNPASDRLHVEYKVKQEGRTTMLLTDALSRKTEVMTERFDAPGSHQLTINLGEKYPSGLYFLTLKNGSFSEVQKFIVQ